MSEYPKKYDKIDELNLFIIFLTKKHPQIPKEFSEWKKNLCRDEYPKKYDKINEFNLFIIFISKKYPQIPKEFSEWKNNLRSDKDICVKALIIMCNNL